MYHHTQSATVTRIAAWATVVVALGTAIWVGARPVLLFVVGIAMLGVVTLGSMTTEVDHERVRFWFGLGWIGRYIPLRDIHSWTAVTNPWWYGWGIHLTPHGWLYNVGGRGAVQLELQDGRRLRVGTDEPARLSEAIKAMKG
jgi:hypothetical protein